jgi:predicted nuclease of predicted toxin-antitoxin system
VLKLLLDENLSPTVALALRAEGHDVVHVRDRGLLGATDRQVLERAFTEDRVLVTANVGDFIKLATARELHAGIVVISDGGLMRDEQLEVLRRSIQALSARADTVNLVLSVELDGGLNFQDLPARR